uniref:uncharacterized protein LOC120337583 n=1 Tax=Styela clava TaxID=7725 RepID=UPI001939702E|nr:uncharacterized protein LOC120337583 [Styela clava]XP_039261354.1 uncharacterized protein LOC120337583 [Styela clava]
MYIGNIATSLFVAFALLASVLADLKVLSTTASSIEWNLEDQLKPENKYTAEVIQYAGSSKVRVIDEPIRTKIKSYRAFNLKSNGLYQLQIRMAGVKGIHIMSPPTYTNLKCYSCTGVKDADSCTKVIECSPNERQCYTRVRYLPKSGGRFSISKGCKVSTDVCKPNLERIKIQREANSETGDLTDEQVLKTMPGLKFFGSLEKLFQKSPSILKRVKKKYNENKKNMLQNALKANCSQREDPTNFCRCCCNSERCNHGMMDCGLTDPPDYKEAEPLPPDIATTAAPTTIPETPMRKVAPVCRDFNGGCDHICIPINKTSVRCECYEDYTLQEDGQTCKTHLLHAVADAGPDITITLPQNRITISAINTKGSVKRYRWWAPIAYGDIGGMSVSNTTQRDLNVVNLSEGTYKFILTVTGMDGRRSSDVMTLTVKPHPSTINEREETAKLINKPVKLQVTVIGQSRFGSVIRRKEYKNFVKKLNVTTVPPSTTTLPRLLFRSKPTMPKISIFRRSRISKPKTTPVVLSKGPLLNQTTRKPVNNKTKPTRPRISKPKRRPTARSRVPKPTTTENIQTSSSIITTTSSNKNFHTPNQTRQKSQMTRPAPTTSSKLNEEKKRSTETPEVKLTTEVTENNATSRNKIYLSEPTTAIKEGTPSVRTTPFSAKPTISKAMPTPISPTTAKSVVFHTRSKKQHQGSKMSSGKKGM